MAFTIQTCLKETCDGVSFVDTTGVFALDNPNGYNGPGQEVPTLNVSTGEFGYTTYQLELFYAVEGGFDSTGNPDYTANLLTWPHTVDTNPTSDTYGHVTWDFSLDDLGLETTRSGWWLARITAIWVNSQTYDYSQDDTFGFTGDLTSKIDQTMKRFYSEKGTDGNCGCQCGDTNINTLYQKYRIWRDFIGCVAFYDQFQVEADWLYEHYIQCSC